MKPFSKSEALQGKPVVTRNGKKVLYITEVPLDIMYPVVAVVEGVEEPHIFTSDGNFLKSQDYHTYDLFMASTKKEGWIAFGTNQIKISSKGIVGFATHVWSTEDEAKRYYYAGNEGSTVHTVKVAWEE
jgi:hypothetical protein